MPARPVSRAKRNPAEEAAELRAATREAHAATKDLRVAIREARELARGEISAQLDEAVRLALDEATAKVAAQFDEFVEILLGRDKASRREGRVNIDDLVQRTADGEEREGETGCNLS